MSDEATAHRLGKLLREGGAGEPGATGQDPELARLLRTTRAVARPVHAAPRRKVLGLLLAAAALLAGLGAMFLERSRDLTFHVRGAARVDERSISAESGEPVQVRFSDGSSFDLAPGARLRVESTTADGALLSLLDGETLASVVHRARTRWALRCGPFEVAVVGTRFSARWDAERQQLWVELHEGAVRVNGGHLDAPVALRAGQRLELSTTGRSSRVSPLATALDEPLPPADPSHDDAAIVKDEPRTAAPRPRPTPWRTLMARSDFASIVEQAEAMGVERCLATCSPENLRILADAARYSGKLELAESSLVALRRRSPAQAAAAAFFLGRLLESRGQSARALAMYEQHLVEAPRSDYAEQAMAGRMRILVRMGDAERARAAARGYLQGFPDGVHADTARRLLQGGARP